VIQIPPQIISKYDRPGPRYTSYPAAPYWSDAFKADQFLHHLAQADREQGPLSVYVHLPFCREMCRFCGCNAVATRDGARADRYLDTLEREVALVAAHLRDRREVSQLHFGGGTPTFLDEGQLSRCHQILARQFHFSADAEKAIEIDPVVTTKGQLELLSRLGFRRISMGVQDFDATVQQAVGRLQGETETAELVEHARRCGFRSVNIDLMYGLPHQSAEGWRRTLDRVLAMSPDRAAVFGFAYVPWAKPHQRLLPREALPSPEQRVQLFLMAAEAFTRSGYLLIGLDHFARASDELARARREGVLTRNFQGYTVRPATGTIAFGMSSISDLGGAYAQNAHQLGDWARLVEAGVLPVERGMALSRDDAMRRFVIDRVMCLCSLDLREVAARFGDEARDAIRPALLRSLPGLEEDGLVAFDGETLRLLPLGQLFVRNVAMLFDAYLEKAGGPRQFSRTV